MKRFSKSSMAVPRNKKSLKKIRAYMAATFRRAKHKLAYFDKDDKEWSYQCCCDSINDSNNYELYELTSSIDSEGVYYYGPEEIGCDYYSASKFFGVIFNRKNGLSFWWPHPNGNQSEQAYSARFVALELAALAVLDGIFDKELKKYVNL